jgi:predicted nucleic acid-binding Zn ribbon protein
VRRRAQTRRDPRLNRERERERRVCIFFSLSLSRELSRERERKLRARVPFFHLLSLSVLGVVVLVKNEDERVLLLQTLAGDV